MFWRRKQETMNDPTDHSPIEQDEGAKTYAEVVRDREAAEQVISDARSDEPAPEWERKYLDEEASGVSTGVTGDDLDPDITAADLPQAVPAGDAAHPYASRVPLEDYSPEPAMLTPSRYVLASAPVAVPLVTPHREPCTHCEGTGHMPSISDYLRESFGWITETDPVIRRFYERMVERMRMDAEQEAIYRGVTPEAAVWQAGQDAVDDILFLFPGDLVSADIERPGDSPGMQQRDRLAKAIMALATMYDPADGDKMQRLDSAIESMGTRHAAFARRDGTVMAATWEEYHHAKRALFDVLGTLGDRFTKKHAAAWSIAYDYAASGMIQAQQRSGMSFPRFPRA